MVMESAITPIGEGEVLLHAGLHKTGTTALQVALADARGELEQHGVRYPGKGLYHHKAILAGADRPYGWRNNGARITPKKHWNRMLKEADFAGRTIISSEFLDDIAPEIGARVVDDLGGRERVNLVVTLRAIGNILPSAWQQRLKAGYTGGYNAFLKQIFAADLNSKARHFWYRHDQVAQIQRWAEIVGPDRVDAVVIPDGDRTAIFTAFEGLLGLPPGFLAQRQVQIQNRSMTAPEAEFVRRINKAVADDLSWDDYQRVVRRTLILTMVEQRTPARDEPRILDARPGERPPLRGLGHRRGRAHGLGHRAPRPEHRAPSRGEQPRGARADARVRIGGALNRRTRGSPGLQSGVPVSRIMLGDLVHRLGFSSAAIWARRSRLPPPRPSCSCSGSPR